MNEHEHRAKDEQATKPAQDEVAKKAYAAYLKEGRPQGHAEQNWLDLPLNELAVDDKVLINPGRNSLRGQGGQGGQPRLPASIVIVAINAPLLRLKVEPSPEAKK